jgi:hypothetical protein
MYTGDRSRLNIHASYLSEELNISLGLQFDKHVRMKMNTEGSRRINNTND